MARKSDILNECGYLALGSRLKRLAERLQADAARLHDRMGYPIKPAQFPLLAALDARGPLTVSEAVEILGVSQPAVTRTLGGLTELGLVETQRSRHDARFKRLQLTIDGETLVRRMKRELWPNIEAAASGMASGPSGDLLTLITRVEHAMAEQSLEARVAGTLAGLRIRPFEDALAPTFAAITRAWVEDLFELEANDRALIEDPRATIVEPGGEIIFVEADGLGVIGTCALMVAGSKTFELTKMGVLARARGRNAGAFMLEAVLDRARAMHAHGDLDVLFLLTNSRCKAAIHLYEKHGFVHDASVMERFGARYDRCDVAMSLPLTPSVD